MKLVEMKCQRCNAVLKVPADATDISCEYCGANYKLDDEAIHHKLDDAEDIGYKMEKGRQRARKEALDETLGSASEGLDSVENAKMTKTVSVIVIIIFAVAFIGIVAGMIFMFSSSRSASDSFEQARKEQQQMIEDFNESTKQNSDD